MIHRRTIAVVLTALAATAGTALGQVQQLSLTVEGMACPFCAYNMEKRIKKLDGVAKSAKVDTYLDKGLTIVPWSPTERFEPSSIRKAVKESGFTLRSMGVEVSGVLSAAPVSTTDTLDLLGQETDQVFHLVRDDRADHAESWDALKAYASGAGAGMLVTVDGVVVEDTEKNSNSWRVAVERWAPTVFGAEVEMKIDGFACERCSARTMRSLRELKDVIHIEADHTSGFVRLWTTSESPDTDALRQRITELGFMVTHTHTHMKGDETHDASTMSRTSR